MWEVLTTDVFDRWYWQLNDKQRTDVLAMLLVLREKGPGLGRPYADTLQGSTLSNLKELRIQSQGQPLRAFFAFAPSRKGIVLCAGNKQGSEKRFYKQMIAIAENEYQRYCEESQNG